jgi:hypothetical protein
VEDESNVWNRRWRSRQCEQGRNDSERAHSPSITPEPPAVQVRCARSIGPRLGLVGSAAMTAPSPGGRANARTRPLLARGSRRSDAHA